MAIETIKAGDYVLSFDEGKKEKSYKKVTDTFVRTTDLIYTVSFVNGEKLETTWNHPFWVLKKSVVRESGQVELGASLVAARFIDSDSLSGENNSSLDGEWISAKDLKAGDVSLTAGGKRLLIASITPSSQSETVYNFSVADNHTYFVGDSGVLVHNTNYNMQEPSNRTALGRWWDSKFNRAGEGVLDAGSGRYTGRVYRDGGSFFGLFGATIYHERINSNTGNTEMVNIRSVTGDNDQRYRHETSYSRTNNGGRERNDYIWSGDSRNGAKTNVGRPPINFSNSIVYRQEIITNPDGTGSTRLVGQNNLFTSGFIQNDNPRNYNAQVAATRLVNQGGTFPIHSQQDYQIFRNSRTGPLEGNFVMGGYTVSNRVDPNEQGAARMNYFGISTQQNDATPNRYETTRRIGNQTVPDVVYSPLTNMSLSHPYHGSVASYPAGTFPSAIHQPDGAHYEGHFGNDLLGNPDLFAVEGGTITSINPSNNTITILTDSNRTISYLHASGYAANVFPNQRVPAGSYIGRMGNIGKSTDAHLHLEGVGNTQMFYNRYGGGQRGCGTSPNCSIQ